MNLEEVRKEFFEKFRERIRAQKEGQKMASLLYGCIKRSWDFGFRLAFVDLLRVSNEIKMIHAVDTFELYNYAFPRIQFLSRISENVLDDFMMLSEKIFIPPYVICEFLNSLSKDVEDFDECFPKLKEIIEKRHYEELSLNRSIRKIVAGVRRVSHLSRFYDPESPIRRIEKFLDKYKPLELDDILENGKIDLDTIKSNPFYSSCLNSIKRARWGVSWEEPNEIDAQTSALTLLLNSTYKQSLYFSVFSGSTIFEKIIWKRDPIREVSIGRRYAPLFIRSVLQTVSDVKDKEIKNYVEEFVKNMEDPRMPDAYKAYVIGNLSEPFSVFLGSLYDYLREVRDIKISNDELQSIPFREVREYAGFSIKEVQELMINTKQINEIRSKALENLRRLHETMEEFIKKYEELLLPKQKERLKRRLNI